MPFSEEDKKNLNEAFDKKGVELCLKDICDTIKKFDSLDEDETNTYKSRLCSSLKEEAEIVEATKDYVLVETHNMKIELIDGVVVANSKP